VKFNAEVGLYGLGDVLLDQWDIRRDQVTAGKRSKLWSSKLRLASTASVMFSSTNGI
jgi:hypothetical protein